MKFLSLSCAWQNIVLVNYRIDPNILTPYLPRHTYLDLYEGECLISIVGFLFKDVRIMGIPLPYHQLFEEFNLRFYVVHKNKGETKRGVVFLREFAPNSGITLAANAFAREKYRKYAMKHTIERLDKMVSASYSFEVKDHWNRVSAKAEALEREILPGSLEDFIAEHYYGYNKWYGNRTMEIKLKRPAWKYQKLLSFDVDCRFEDFYPPQFLPFLYEEPHSVQFITGSPVDMMPSRIF
ncbi:MAG: DUF2071 domain-containing protein [Anditalea sp.]